MTVSVNMRLAARALGDEVESRVLRLETVDTILTALSVVGNLRRYVNEHGVPSYLQEALDRFDRELLK